MDLVMKAYIFLCVILVGCGGESYQKQDWEIDRELCEAQDGTAQLLDVVNVDTGERRYEIECVFDKSPKYGACKPDNGRGQECPKI